MKQQWTGHYVYGDEYGDMMGEGRAGNAAAFEIEWELVGNKISGICIDEEVKDMMASPPTIDGTITDGVISFVKTYPHQWLIGDDNNNVTDKDKPGHEVVYNGVWTDDHFAGEWTITMLYADDEGDLQPYNCGNGTWTLHLKRAV